jgi:hypothetical protein
MAKGFFNIVVVVVELQPARITKNQCVVLRLLLQRTSALAAVHVIDVQLLVD